MVSLHFNSTEEFESLFKTKTLAVTRGIISGIEQALSNRKKVADLFHVSFAEVELAYQISLNRSEWQFALENCLDHLHREDLTDEQIDCWKLLEVIKTMK